MTINLKNSSCYLKFTCCKNFFYGFTVEIKVTWSYINSHLFQLNFCKRFLDLYSHDNSNFLRLFSFDVNFNEEKLLTYKLR